VTPPRRTPFWVRGLHAAIGRALPFVMQRALRRGLAGVWTLAEAPLPAGGAVLIANHHAWWDVYLAWAIAARHGRPSGAIMDDAQLARFPFFRHLGVVSTREPRAAARRAAAGAWLMVYVEGALRSPGPLGPTREGAAALARWANVPLLPVAIRVVMRGADRPEAYLRFAAPLPPGTPHGEAIAALAALLGRLDDDLRAATDPEAPLAAYHPWWPAAARDHERIGRWRTFWGGA
jgi:1-acyl-sn-glycerol-3-phosphate acyltransferase